MYRPKPWRLKGFLQFEKIINVQVSSLWFIWIPMLWVYGHYKYDVIYPENICKSLITRLPQINWWAFWMRFRQVSHRSANEKGSICLLYKGAYTAFYIYKAVYCRAKPKYSAEYWTGELDAGPVYYLHYNPYSAGTDFSRQNLTSVDVRFWRPKSIPAL